MFLGDISGFLALVFCVPCQPVAEQGVCLFVFSFSSLDICLFIFLGYLGLQESQTPGDKKRKIAFVYVSTGAHRTRVHSFRIYLCNTAEAFVFCAHNMCKLRSCIVISGFQRRIDLWQ